MPCRCHSQCGHSAQQAAAEEYARPPAPRSQDGAFRRVQVHEQRDDGRIGYEFVQQRELLRRQFDTEPAHSGDALAWPIEARIGVPSDMVISMLLWVRAGYL